ncbi:MAG: hypothetical protein LBH43_17130 [Treponema sp.]|nr:hypothetical protein [Treponema sp.]
MPVNEADDVLHRIRIKLHKSNLPQAEGRAQRHRSLAAWKSPNPPLIRLKAR